MMFGVMAEFLKEFFLSSFSVSEFVGGAWGRRDEITKIRVEGVINESYEDVRAEAGCSASMGTLIMRDDRSRRVERIKFMHPCSRLGMLVCKNVRDTGPRIGADTFASSASEAIAHRVVEEAEGIKVGACRGVEAKGVPSLLARAL